MRTDFISQRDPGDEDVMKAKCGYKKQKHLWNIGNYFKRYFEIKTCKRWRWKLKERELN